MFIYSSDETVIPSLTFTKAELAYALFILLKDIPITNTSTKLEMVEIRHYLNQIKDKVLLASYDGELKKAMEEEISSSTKEELPHEEPTPAIPSMVELKEQFPTLSETEIEEILSSIQKEKEQGKDSKKTHMPPSPSFLLKQQPSVSDSPSSSLQQLAPPLTGHKDDIKKFESMLGSF